MISGIQTGNAILIEDLQNLGTSYNLVFGNFIGVDSTGNVLMANQTTCLAIENASNNRIGGLTPDSTNVISGSELDHGVQITGDNATSNHVVGNYIGTNANGNLAIRNNSNGVLINDGPSGNIIADGNVISGNGLNGIEINNGGEAGNHIIGNKIGLNAVGDSPIPNLEGIRINGSSNNVIGGPNPNDWNIISGNLAFGIKIVPIYSEGVPVIQSVENIIQSNFIGTDNSGTSLVSNGDDGIHLDNVGNNHIISNILCGAGVGSVGNNGIEIIGENSSYNEVIGNFIGTNASSTPGLGNAFQGIQIANNAHDNTIGPDNVISGNLDNGILIEGEEGIGANNNTIFGNYIGTNVDGTAALGNLSNGILIMDGASNNRIGGATLEEKNIISGNQVGIRVEGLGSTQNVISENIIGTNSTGSLEIGNGWGIYIYTSNNTIGGVEPGSGNVISGNINQGLNIISSPGSEVIASNNKVIGNIIGLDVTGSVALGNGSGMLVVNAPSNIIGGATSAECNIISGNGTVGLYIGWMGATNNRIEGNFIGTDISGTTPLGNGDEGILINGPGNIIGGTEPGTGNLISGNQFGVRLKT